MGLEYINEAFKRLDILTENLFDTTDTGLTELADFMDQDEQDDTITIISDEIENNIDDSEVAQLGKIVLECNVCKALSFKDKSDIEFDDEGIVNKEHSCPKCGMMDGYVIVGEITKYPKETELEEVPEEIEEIPAEEQPVEEIVKEENLEESLNEASDKTPWDIIVAAYPELNKDNGDIVENFEDSLGRKAWSSLAMKAYEDAAKKLGLENFEMTMDDEDQAHFSFKKNNEEFNKVIDSDITHVTSIEDAIKILQYVAAGKLDEAFKNVSLETDNERMTMTSEDNGKVTVTTEPIEVIEEEEATIAPISPETEEELINANIEIVDEPELSDTEDITYDESDINEVEEDSINELGESYFKRVYENVDSFKTSNIYTTPSQLIIEGLIQFKSGAKKSTGFILEAIDKCNNKVRFIGENKHLSRGSKAFTLIGSLNEGKLIAESFTYNYRAKTPEGKPTRVYGTISRKR